MKNIVVLTGAGISVESGISTYRDSDRLHKNYNVKDQMSKEEDDDSRGILDFYNTYKNKLIDIWKNDPGKVLDFYNIYRKNLKDIQPNQAHILLKELEEFHNVQIITQNVDDLHEKAGSFHITHLHGKLNEVRSEKNPRIVKEAKKDIALGDLASDGAQLRPNIVWFGEDVPMIEHAKMQVEMADVLLVIGTSLQVYPAAFLLLCVKKGVPVYFIDPNPSEETIENVTYIKKTASEGMKDFFQYMNLEIN